MKTKSYHQLLTADLMVDYDSINCPSSVDNTSGPVNVSIGPSLFQILEVVRTFLVWDHAPALLQGLAWGIGGCVCQTGAMRYVPPYTFLGFCWRSVNPPPPTRTIVGKV